MFKIQTLNKISGQGLSLLPNDKYEIASEFSDPDAILLRSFKMHDMELGKSLKAVGRAGAGVNNIPIDKCTEKGVVVFNTPGANANAVKELVLCGMLLASRKIVEGVKWVDTLKGKGPDVGALVEKNKGSYGGTELIGKTLGLIGLGAIGLKVANDAKALGMDVLGYDPFISVDKAWQLDREVKKAQGMDSLLAMSDYISLHVPLTDKTKGLINKEKLSIMKKGVKILNFSRGELVNTQDLIEALADGTVSYYVTDFPSDELIGQENVLCIPHLGASTEEAEENCAMMVAMQVRDFLENGNIINSVNFPECVLPRNSGTRLVVINKNIPAMVGQFSTVLAGAKLNISEMINKSKDAIAYNILDIEGDVSDDILDKLRSIDGVIRVWKI